MSEAPAFWLSFADPALPEGEQFLGVVVLRPGEEDVRLATERAARANRPDLSGNLFLAAVRASCRLGVNPGGEVQGFRLPEEELWRIPDDKWEVLLSHRELEEAEML